MKIKTILVVAIILLVGALKNTTAQTKETTITETSYDNEIPKKKRNLWWRKNKVKIEYITDTVYIVDTVYKVIEKVSNADTIFNIKNFDTAKAIEIDSLINKLFAENYVDNINSFTKVSLANDSIFFDSKVRYISDSVLQKRFELMYTQINLPYHPMLKRFISRYVDNEKTMNILLGRALYYMPIFENELINQNMPLELKLLPIIESSLRPNAVSYMGAGGLWQFMPYTGKMYGLKITSLVDERFDPIKSTKAACKYLKDLYNIYDSWTLAIAAYNCGPGNVNKAIARAKNAKSYWDIYPYLPMQTRDYVPAFIAANYAFTFYKSHNIEFDAIPEIITTDTVTISNRVLDLRQISSTLGISEKSIKMLNPQFKSWIVPAISKPYTIYLPQKSVLEFSLKENEIYAKELQYLPKRMTAEDIEKLEAKPKTHTVRSGDVLGAISRKYRVSVKQIMRLNNIKNANSLRIGQRLRLS